MISSIRQYRVLRKLGAGGMGEVYLCEDPQLTRRAAVKVLPADFAGDAHRKHRFIREARAAAQLSHPNICVVFEAGETSDGIPFIAMEYIDGVSLRERLAAGRLSIGEALDIGIEIAEALEAAHQQRILHRDIKPANVMLTRSGRVKVVDFGLAKVIRDDDASGDDASTDMRLSAAGQFVGTVPYASPEQAQGRDVDRRSDIFSFGILLYELVAGELPFRGASTVETLHQIIAESPAPLSSVRRDAPPELERIVNKCLQKEPQRRYQSAGEIAIDLRNLKSPAATTSRPAQRPWRPMIFAVLALAAILAIALWAWHFRSAAKPELRSVAVMPFANETGDPQLDYLSDGLTESIINALSQRPNLRVVPRSTVFYYKKKNVTPQEVASQLHVVAIVTGRVGRAGDQLDVQADLIDVASDSQRWGGRLKASRGDMLGVEDQMSRDVLAALGTGASVSRAAQGGTTDREAFDLYLRARYAASRRTPDSLTAAIPLLQHAIERDPHYGLAYSQLADVYMLGVEYGGWRWSEMQAKTAAAADRGLMLAPDIAQAHMTAGQYAALNWQWSEAEKEFRKAIAIDPREPQAWLRLGLLKSRVDRDAEALQDFQHAKSLDPLASIIRANIARDYHKVGDVDRALAEARELVKIDPDFALGHAFLGEAYARRGEGDAAIEELQRAAQLSQNSPFMVSKLGFIEAFLGRRKEAEQIAGDLETRHKLSGVPLSWAAMVYAGLGDLDRAFVCIEQDYRDRVPTTSTLAIWWEFEPLRRDQRYADLLRRMGLR